MAATDELTLLERVFLRVGSAETDDQLQNAISKFLLPVLLKLSSQQDGVRKKVMELLVHINKRIKCRPKIQLPVEALLLQYQDPSATSFVINFTIIYIKMGYPRLDPDKQVELIPSVLNCIEGKPQSHQDSLLLMLMPVLRHIKVPTDPAKCKSLFGLREKVKVAKLMLDFMLDVLLLPYGIPSIPLSKHGSIQVSVTVESGTSGMNSNSQALVTSTNHPGLSEYAYKRITGENPPSPEELEQIKMGIVKLLGSGVFPEDDVIVSLIVASSDTRHGVVNAADLELKRLNNAVNISNAPVISKLYSLFLGTVSGKEQASVKPELRRCPTNARVRLKILPYLLKSREAALHFPACIQMVFDCLYGANTNAKLRLMAVQFVHHITLNCSEARLLPIAPVLLSGMTKLIAEAKDDTKLRGLAYIAIGKLGNKLPHLVNKDLALLQSFFDALSQEEQDTRLAIQEALMIMSTAFVSLDTSNKKIMEALLLSSMERSEPQVRLLAVHYAATVFPSDDIPSRYLLLLAAGDMKEEVYAEAAKTLGTVPTKGKKSLDDNSQHFPSFVEMIVYIDGKTQQRLKSKQLYTVGIHKLPFSPATCTEMVTYLRLCLAHSAGLKPTLESCEQTQDQAPTLSRYIRNLLQAKSMEREPVQAYVNFVKMIVTSLNGSASSYCLLEVVAVAADKLAFQFMEHLEWIKNLMFSSTEDTRIHASQLYAIVIVQCLEDSKFVLAVCELTKCLKDKSLERQHGGLLALGYTLGRKMTKNGKDALERLTGTSDAVIAIAQFLESPQILLVGAASTALGEIGRCGIIPLPDSDSNVSKLSIVMKLSEIFKSSKYSTKIREKSALAASYFCVGDVHFPLHQVVVTKFLECANDIRDVDLQLTVGEALAWTSLRSSAPVARDFWVVSEEEFVSCHPIIEDEEEGSLAWLLKEIFGKYVTSQNPFIRQASCVWLLTLLKRCGSHSAIKNQFQTLQKIFINLLSESNEITQDLASKGLGLLYECCEDDQKSGLVSILVDTLTNGRRPLQQVTDDSCIFEEGSLGQTPQGGGLSTYKELCSFASDLNQPDLVYKFMHLANHNAIWNSKKGAAFGFGTIAAKAGEQLQSHLPKIIPKLYRYQFDPNIKIQQSMAGIWHAIVQDPQKVIDQYVKEILTDLKNNLTHNTWRTRESSCLALADLLRGRQLDLIVDDLPYLWEICFRVRDDIKESVRLAAESALKALSKVTIRACDTGSGSVGQKAIASVLPVLLKSGLSSPVIEVRTVSLATVTKIGKSSGLLLKPHIPLLVTSLLESLSALEQQELNYLSVRLGNEQDSQEKLDNIRISAAKTSTMMDTINQCLPFIDAEVLENLMPRLIDLIKNSVGLGTKAGCAHFVISLVHHCLNDLQQHTGKLLLVLLNGLNDRSRAIRKTYALAIGHLVKAAKDSTVEKLLDRLKPSYLTKEDPVAQQTCAFVLHAIAKQTPDVLKRHAADALPLAFLAMQGSKQDVEGTQNDTSIWEDIWTDLTPGSEAGIRLYLTEIVAIVQTALESQSWITKARGAAAISTVATKLKSSLDKNTVSTLLSVGVGGLSGRTWLGKEQLLRAVADLCINFKDSIRSFPDNEADIVTMKEVVVVMLKECNKENLIYKKEALRCTAEILHACGEDAFEEVFCIVKSIMQKTEMDEDVEENLKHSANLVELQEVAFVALGKSWPDNQTTQERYFEELCEFLCSQLDNHIPKVQTCILKALNHFVERLYLLNVSSTSDDGQISLVVSNIIPRLNLLAENVKSSAIKIEILNIFDTIVSKLKAANRLGLLLTSDLEKMRRVASQIVRDSQTELHEKGNRVIHILND